MLCYELDEGVATGCLPKGHVPHAYFLHDVDAFYALEYGTSNAAQTPCSNVLKSREPPKSRIGRARLSCLPQVFEHEELQHVQ